MKTSLKKIIEALQKELSETKSQLLKYQRAVADLHSRKWAVTPARASDGSIIEEDWLYPRLAALKALVPLGGVPIQSAAHLDRPNTPSTEPKPEKERNSRSRTVIPEKADTAASPLNTPGTASKPVVAVDTPSSTRNLASILSKPSR